MRLRSLLVAGLSALIVLISAGPPVNLVSARSVATDSAFIDVPLYTQQRNLSCEYASLVIAMGAYDTWVSEWTFDDLVPLSDNPHWGYRGDINGTWGNTTNYGVQTEARWEATLAGLRSLPRWRRMRNSVLPPALAPITPDGGDEDEQVGPRGHQRCA